MCVIITRPSQKKKKDRKTNCFSANKDVQEEKIVTYYLSQRKLDHWRGETER